MKNQFVDRLRAHARLAYRMNGTSKRYWYDMVDFSDGNTMFTMSRSPHGPLFRIELGSPLGPCICAKDRYPLTITNLQEHFKRITQPTESSDIYPPMEGRIK